VREFEGGNGADRFPLSTSRQARDSTMLSGEEETEKEEGERRWILPGEISPYAERAGGFKVKV